MARLARVLAVDIPHHVTQRGNARRSVFESDSDRLIYLQLLRGECRLQSLSLVGYCLMPNHVHLIVVPRRTDSLPLALKYAHGRYAVYFNARRASSGHLWQGRYYSCPLDAPHLWAALRYAELNPVRAGLAADAPAYPWSSAAAHCGGDAGDSFLEMQTWRECWSTDGWRDFLGASGAEDETELIRRSTHTGRPLGAPEFIAGLEIALRRRLAPERGGRPRKREPFAEQQILCLGERQN